MRCMMQSRNVALATIVIMPIARWNRLTTRNVFDVPTAMSREGYARNPNASEFTARSTESAALPPEVAIAKRSTRSPYAMRRCS